MGKRNKIQMLERVEIIDIASEGKAIAKPDGKVIFVKNAVPGDIADLRIYRSKKGYAEAEATHFHELSPHRTAPACIHFGTCGGCKWQHLNYEQQLVYKHQQVQDQFERVGKFPFERMHPIKGAAQTYHYRNKLEFTFSNKRWITDQEALSEEEFTQRDALGFHIPGRFDKILDIEQCWLQHDFMNRLRNDLRAFALANELSFFDLRAQTGLLRTFMLRNNRTGNWMIVLAFGEDQPEQIEKVLTFLIDEFPEITTLCWVLNQKKNDTIHDLPIHIAKGPGYITETLDGLEFKIGPKSFFQTNPQQAEVLYQIARDYAGLTGSEIVYDLYTGTGTIALYVARQAKKVIGIEYVPEAIEDAFENARLNQITNTDFFAGDMKDVLSEEFIHTHGKPDVIITDPPRAGMHTDVIERIKWVAPSKIMYVSCNPATQARDIALLADMYTVREVQPVDMFPHTHHVENVALLVKK